ncbi:MAG TPA: cytochrome c biogenesis protein CcsA [Terriglobales bacterium]|nr:cytochrome c biogenesis protein CcsA [Terriglobales bacterium]
MTWCLLSLVCFYSSWCCTPNELRLIQAGMKRAFPIFALITAALLSYALYEALVAAPTEQTMGNVQRIFYYHVPSAWTAFLLFFINFLCSVQYLVHSSKVADRITNWVVVAVAVATCVAAFAIRPLPAGIESSSVATTGLAIAALYFLIRKYFSGEKSDVLAVVSAEVGVVFCTVVLVTGPLWARPVWGIWWTWDVRLTSTLVLWLIYISYLMLRRFSTSSETPKLAAALAIFGALDVPLVYFSIWIFRTQHPQPVIGGGGSIDPRMLHVLLINWLAFLCFAGLMCWSRYRLEILQRELEETQALEALLEPRSPR